MQTYLKNIWLFFVLLLSIDSFGQTRHLSTFDWPTAPGEAILSNKYRVVLQQNGKTDTKEVPAKTAPGTYVYSSASTVSDLANATVLYFPRGYHNLSRFGDVNNIGPIIGPASGDIFLNYTNSQTLRKADGSIVPWIYENFNPYTGDWIARTMLKNKGQDFNERGKDYNHSSYVDLRITGLIGLKPSMDDIVEVNPVLPNNAWEYFCLDKIYYHCLILAIIWDKTGTKYNLGKGLILLCDGKEIARSETLSKVIGKLK